MEIYNDNMEDEKKHLKNTIELLKELINIKTDKLTERRKELISTRRDMWENSAHFSNDFDKLTEVNQHLQQVQRQSCDYESTRKSVEKYEGMLDAPYFGRLDFKEEGYVNEKIYVGKGNVTDPESQQIIIYDWRAPISSMFYRFEPGKASYSAPFEEITGEITLKRQYKITKSELKYFFDCSIQIMDEILQEVLSRNSSSKMRNIIETIQKEQDLIIRDTSNDLLIVQGVAGSGKTSIALHRVAFLLYEGMTSKIFANNILILSPNDAFNDYIGQVLPELGEQNVEGATMEGIVKECLENEIKRNNHIYLKGRNDQLEECISGRSGVSGQIISKWVQFKGSHTFKHVIDRFLKLYEHQLLKFEDVYYHGILIADKSELKAAFLNNKTGMPMAKRLARVECRIMDKIVDLRKEQLKKLEKTVQRSDGHEFEVRSFARRLLMKDSQAFAAKIKRFVELDVISMYKGLFKDKSQFYKLSKGLVLPDDIENIMEYTVAALDLGNPDYEDLTAIAYMKLKIYGKDLDQDIRQVVVDEVQDYYPMQLAILKELYGTARFTVVGDVAQSIERSGEVSIYDDIPELLQKKNTVQLILNRSYRSSFEINEFTKSIYGMGLDSVSFPRHDEVPEVLWQDTPVNLYDRMTEKIKIYVESGFETVAILCKTMKQTEDLYHILKGATKLRMIDHSDSEMRKGCMIMPVYAAKGLEFDAVLIYGVDDENYCTELEGRLLYIACTRALHRLSLYYTGQKSRFLKNVK